MSNLAKLMNSNSNKPFKDSGFFQKHDISQSESTLLLFKQNGFSICDEEANAAMYEDVAKFDNLVMDQVTVPFMQQRNIKPESLSQDLLGQTMTSHDAMKGMKAYEQNTVDAEFEIIESEPPKAGNSGMKLLPPGKL